jgi:hypothetical protein
MRQEEFCLQRAAVTQEGQLGLSARVDSRELEL